MGDIFRRMTKDVKYPSNVSIERTNEQFHDWTQQKPWTAEETQVR
jgi:hypothetical protein